MRPWQTRVNDLESRTTRLVHLAARMDVTDQSRLRESLLKAAVRAYADELTIQAARAGCPGRQGRLTTGAALTELNDKAKEDAASIVATYNYDLVSAIEHIKAQTPSANRNTYASRLAEWDLARNSWKSPQIAEYTEGYARSLAQRDFASMNNLGGVARLEPTTAKCEVCSGWIRRGDVPVREATANPPPYHPFCPHIFVTSYDPLVPKSECPLLWVGE